MEKDVATIVRRCRGGLGWHTQRRAAPRQQGLGRLARAGAALLALGIAALTLGAPPAAAAPTVLTPTLDCIVVGDGTYQAVFGYDSKAKSTMNIPVGSSNTLNPSSFNGVQPTQFTRGRQSAVFATPPVPDSQTVSWTLDGTTVTARSTSKACGPKVSLPAEGNGIGPVLVLVSTVLLSLGLLYVRQRRERRRSA